MSWSRGRASKSKIGRGSGLRVARVLVLIGLAGAAAGCASIATPRLPEDVAAALTDHDMRRMETSDMILYFPEGRKEQAGRFLERVEGCAHYEKGLARIHNSVADQKMVVILPELAFNNAFVAGRIEGYETVGVVPTYNTTDLFMLEGGIPPDSAIIGCHEITHYVHLQQIAGFAWFLNTLFGQVYTPQEGLDPWFDEGLAVYYETKLQPGVGRLAWPFWHGAFAAGVAGHRINGGDLNASNRDFFGGNHYLIGSEFISFLANRYGEQKLWDLIAVQARSVLFPFAIDVRFWQAYDSSLSTLIDEFADDVAKRNPVVARPPAQRVLRQVGDRVRYGRAADGTEVLLTADHDQPSRLVIIAPDGRTLVERDLIDVVSPRTLLTSSPRLSGSPTFTADGKTVFFVAIDQGATYQVAKLLRYQIASDTLEIVHADLQGAGGAISPDGTRYVFPRAAGDHHDLTELDLRTGAMRTLAPQPPRGYVAVPHFSPDGRRLAATVYDGARFSIRVFDAATGATVTTLPTGGGPVHEASWADDHRITYVGTSPGDGRFQVYVHDLATGTTAQVTHAPYLAFEPQAAGGRTVRFLNREGWEWTLDEVELPANPAPPPAIVPPPVAPPTPPTTPIVATAGDETPPPDIAAEAAAAAPAPPAVAPGVSAMPPPLPPVPPAVSVGLPPPSVLATERAGSAFDHLFVPSLVAPTAYTDGGTSLLGVVVSGGDHLERHRWTMAGLYQFEDHLYSGSFGYANRQLAPLTIETSASQFETRKQVTVSGGPTGATFPMYQRDRVWQLDAQRSIFGNPLGAGFAFVDRYLPSTDMVSSIFPHQRFAGPYAFASLGGSESTPYTGVRRALLVDLYAALFPADWTTAPAQFEDLRGQIAIAVPVPPLDRDRLTLVLRGRGLAGLSHDDPLLQVGGPVDGMVWEHGNRTGVPSELSPVSPLQMPFVESLRGFEEHALATNRIFIADLTYSYPFIIDWGSASTLGVLPALFLEQIDLNLFATGATTGDQGDRHASAGGSLTAIMDFGPTSLSLRYQLSRRLTDDRGVVMFVMLGN